MRTLVEDYDIVVVGAGHAGCEAALAGARLGLNTVMFTVSVDSTGIRYERMALNGTSGSNLFTGNRTDLDCCRSVHRNCIKLGVYFTQTS